ncbi:PucR family transcriptional regulator [Actinokineospora sp. HUAS TT18]|uniref:PucR family transcriptional regulator n=1 Tax=Actinokineospora sp. HUAS TT18 TaxID=3447451 RepID=UPI003F51D3EE
MALRINGVAVHELIRAGLPAMGRSVIATILEKVAFYEQLPAEALAGDIHAVVDNNLRLVADLARDERLPHPAELTWFAESATRRAEEGVPLEMVLHAYHVGAHEAWRVITADARPTDIDDLRAVTDLLFSYSRAVIEAVTVAYVAELRSSHNEEQSVRHTLLSALLAGDPTEDAARQAGMTLPTEYTVLTVAIGPHADEEPGGVSATIAARRKLRRAQAELNRLAGDRALALLDPTGGTILLPGDKDLAPLVTAMSTAAGADITAATATATPAEVSQTAAHTREVLDVARASGRPPGLYRLADVLLDYQLSRTTPASRALAALLEPLARNEDLLPTLELHLANELNRKLTARMLHIHPNTVDYRLRRITALTGLDPAVPSQLPLLAAALAARRAARM